MNSFTRRSLKIRAEKAANIIFESVRNIGSNGRLFPIFLEVFLVSFCGYCLWSKIFLPDVYFITTILFAIIIGVQLIRKQNNTFLILQIAIFGLFLRNIYNLSTNFGIIPFDDGNWDFGVVKIFLQEESVTKIVTQASSSPLLEWYSSWPLLHVLGSVLSKVCGIDPFYVVLLLPSLISTVTFAFVYLFVESIRKSLKFDWKITAIALLMYVTAAETIFWPMQFTHQNLALLFFLIVLYAFYLVSITQSNKYVAIGVFFALAIVPAHSFSPVILIGFLLLSFLSQSIGNRLSKIKIGKRLFRYFPQTEILWISAFSSGIFLSVWWSNYGQKASLFFIGGLLRFSEILLGFRKFEVMPSSMSYPSLLTPSYFNILLNLRDILVYGLPAILALYIMFFKLRWNPTKFFIFHSTLAFGALIALNYFGFRVELFRLFMFALPVIVLLGAISYNEIIKRLKRTKIFITLFFSTILIISSMIGLWGHSFAPIYLYTPEVTQVEIGDRNIDPMRVNNFFKIIDFDDYSIILADDVNPLLHLLEPKEYYKIRQLQSDGILELKDEGKILVCSFKDLNLYSYYARTFSVVDSLQEAQYLRVKFFEQLDNYTKIYDDGRYRFWVVE